MGIRKIGIIGLGVIGASLGMALRHRVKNIQVMGQDCDNDTILKAFEVGAIDCLLDKKSIKESDVIVIATPLRTIPEIIIKMKDSLKEGVIVTDVGSVKSWVMQLFTEHLPSHVTFIGGHPLAGSEKSGITGADKFLLQNASYVLTPDSTTSKEKLNQLEDLLKMVGARVVIMEAAAHDKIAAKVSHIPHLMAATILNNFQDEPGALSMAGGGLRDTTRIAGSNPLLWEDILTLNAGALADELRNVIKYLSDCLAAADQKNGLCLRRYLEKAYNIRRNMPNIRPGLKDSLDIIAIIPDQPGFIGKIGTLLGDNDINIHDFRLLGIRDQDEGTIRITVNNRSAKKACQLLKTEGLSAWIRE